MEYGPEDVVDRVYKVHERCRDLLTNATTIGSEATDKFGTRITMTGPKVQKALHQIRGERLQSVEVRRIFEKLEEFA